MKETEDLSIAGPGSPISLKKFLITAPIPKPLSVLVDGTGSGIAHDDENTIYITPQECSQQAIYYVENKFNGKSVPAYLYRYLAYMFLDQELISSDIECGLQFKEGKITEESPDYIQIRNLITYVKSNPEAQQVIGLIQLISGILNISRKENKGVRLYIQNPETSLHPKRCSRFISMLVKIRKEYGGEENEI